MARPEAANRWHPTTRTFKSAAGGATVAHPFYPRPVISILHNYATSALLADLAPTGSTTEGTSISVVGPNGTDNVTVTPINFTNLDVWGNTVAGGEAPLDANMSALRVSVWVYNPGTIFNSYDFTALTDTPTDSATNFLTVPPGIWQRISVDIEGTYNSSTTCEISIGRSANGTSTLYVYEDSLMIENYSSPWTGLHELHTVSAQEANGDYTSVSALLPEMLWGGDSITYGCCQGEQTGDGLFPLPRMLAQHFETTWDEHGEVAAGGRKTNGVLSEFQLIDAGTHGTIPEEALDRHVIFWIGTNDIPSFETAAQAWGNIEDAIDILIARGNYNYLVATVMFRTAGYQDSMYPPDGVGYQEIVDLNNLIRASEKTAGKLIDINAHLGYNFTMTNDDPLTYEDTEGNFNDGLHLTTQGYVDMVYPFFLQRLEEEAWFDRT